jgi:hypothetical protein
LYERLAIAVVAPSDEKEVLTHGVNDDVVRSGKRKSDKKWSKRRRKHGSQATTVALLCFTALSNVSSYLYDMLVMINYVYSYTHAFGGWWKMMS